MALSRLSSGSATGDAATDTAATAHDAFASSSHADLL